MVLARANWSGLFQHNIVTLVPEIFHRILSIIGLTNTNYPIILKLYGNAGYTYALLQARAQSYKDNLQHIWHYVGFKHSDWPKIWHIQSECFTLQLWVIWSVPVSSQNGWKIFLLEAWMLLAEARHWTIDREMDHR